MDPRVSELQCIMPIANIGSVLEHGVLSFESAARLQHISVAMHEVQERRDAARVPGGLRLHQYANLYFQARNPMMYKRRHEAADLCVLSIRLAVLTIPGSVLSDCNAASPYVRFLAPDQHDLIVFDDVLADSWTHPDDPKRQHQHKLRKCAEALIPHRVPPEQVRGAYVRDSNVRNRIREIAPALRMKIVPNMFFAS